MSKAFDTACRSKQLTDLQEVLEPDEMHMKAVLISDVALTVKVWNELGEEIKTEMGTAQGDCLSAVGGYYSSSTKRNLWHLTENA